MGEGEERVVAAGETATGEKGKEEPLYFLPFFPGSSVLSPAKPFVGCVCE